MRLGDLIPLNETLFVWDGIVAWRDYIYRAAFYGNTKSNYLTNMLKLIESEIVNIRIELAKLDDLWLENAKAKIDNYPTWSAATKVIRRCCLNSFYKFIQTDFDRNVEPYRRHPSQNEIKHVLSSVQEKALTKNISPIVLCTALDKINTRDAYIVWLMMHTGWALEDILNIRKTTDEFQPPYIRLFKNGKQVGHAHIYDHISNALLEISKNSTVYLFETAAGKRVLRTQVMRNLKQAGHNIGLDFDLTPKVLHGYVNAYMSKDKRSELEIGLGI